MKTTNWIAYVLTIVGGINWGLVGLFDFNLVDSLFGAGSVLSRAVYILVGLAATYLVVTAARIERHSAHHAV